VISLVADLLNSFVGDQLPTMDAHPVTHGPTIGDMYEGLSEEVLTRAIPENLGVRVVTGFATGEGGTPSAQLDRMLVVGTGERIPNTNAYLWPAKDVIAVVEVKKNLRPKDITDSIANLKSFRSVEQPALEAAAELPRWYDHERLVRCVGQVTGTHIQSLNWKEYDVATRLIGPALFLDQLTALRVVLGFHGHKTERGFRSALGNVLMQTLTSGADFMDLPHLMIGGQFSLVKANGRPYYSSMRGETWIPYFTTPANPLLVLLEMIWTRLDDRFGLGNPWGEDLTTDVGRSFLEATPRVINARNTWDVKIVVGTSADLDSIPVSEPWEPVELTLELSTALGMIAARGPLKSDAPSLVGLASGMGVSSAEFKTLLLETGLVSEGPSGIFVHARQLVTAHLPDGRVVAADDPTGRLARWAAARFTRPTVSDADPTHQAARSMPGGDVAGHLRG